MKSGELGSVSTQKTLGFFRGDGWCRAIENKITGAEIGCTEH